MNIFKKIIGKNICIFTKKIVTLQLVLRFNSLLSRRAGVDLLLGLLPPAARYLHVRHKILPRSPQDIRTGVAN
jgi:hypothetical protein